MPEVTKTSFKLEFRQIYAVNLFTPKRRTRSHFYSGKYTLTQHYNPSALIFLMFFSMFFLGGCSLQKTTKPPLMGQWESALSPKVVVNLSANKVCTLGIIKNPLLPSPHKACEYEVRENYIDLYLKNAQGECGNLPDFELVYKEELGHLILLLPPNNIELHRSYSK